MRSPVNCLLIEFLFTNEDIHDRKTTKIVLNNIDPIIGCKYLVFLLICAIAYRLSVCQVIL